MALPAGVTTCTVVAGVPVTHSGSPVKTFVSIEPSVFLVHAATGTPLVDFLEEISVAEGVSAQFTLPHTDQAGFQDENGNAYTNWYYTARVTYSTPSKAKNKTPKIKVFQLTTGQSTVDLDLLPTGAPALPYTAPTATVSSVNGRTGAVTYLESDLPARLAEPVLAASFAAPQTLAIRSSSYRRPRSTIIADLGMAGHGFTALGTPSASNMNDTTDYVRGTQSASVTTAGTGLIASIRKNVLPVAIDLTGKAVSVSVKVQNVAQLKTISLYLGDTSLANNFVWQLYDGNPGQTTPFQEGEWVRFTADASSLMSTTGAPNLAAITSISVGFLDKSGGATTGKVTGWVNHIAAFPKAAAYPNGVVSFTFDDGFISTSDVAKPYMDRYGFSGTAYIIADLIDSNAYYMTTAKLRTMQEFSGWDIAAHALTIANHNRVGAFTALDLTALDAECRGLREWLIARGFKGVDHFAYPQGLLTPDTESIVQRYFASARSTAQYPFETLPACNPLRLRGQSHSSPGTTLAAAKAKVDAAYANKSWDILTIHDIVPVPNNPSYVQWDTSSFQQLVDYIATKGIAVENVGTVLAKTQTT